MKASVKVIGRQGKIDFIEYEYIEEPPQKIKISIDGCLTRYGNISRWLDTDYQEPVNEIRDLLNSEIGVKIQFDGSVLELISKG